MRRITFWFLSTVSVLVLLFSYRTSTMGAQAVGPSISVTQSDSATGGSAGSVSQPSASPSASSSSQGSSGGSGSGAKTYTGAEAQTQWGIVQVSITVSGGKITAVDVPEYPDGNGRDQEINATALPILKQETLAAQSAQIDTVSGATVTSDGYLTSLQSALDQAGL